MKSWGSLSFKLEKHYLDCIDDSGNCFIIYVCELHLFHKRIYYSSLIFSDCTGITTGKISIRKSGKHESGDLLFFDNKNLLIEGQWTRVDDPLPLFCYTADNNQELVWNCHHPRASAQITFNGNRFIGYGYAETLTLTIKPRNLPIEELRWGRFLSEGYTILWINWKGNYPVKKIFFNGTEYNDPSFEEERIIFGSGDYVLFFSEISLIRKGKLSKLFSRIPWMKIFFSIRILNSVENKYKAKSVLTLNQKISSTGWSLYEIVTWEK